MAHQQSRQVNYILGAALASKRFCTLLLANPEMAINQGFQGYAFDLSTEERNLIIRSTKGAQTVADFAQHLMDYSVNLNTETHYYEGNRNGHANNDLVSNGLSNNGHTNGTFQVLKPDWALP